MAVLIVGLIILITSLIALGFDELFDWLDSLMDNISKKKEDSPS